MRNNRKQVSYKTSLLLSVILIVSLILSSVMPTGTSPKAFAEIGDNHTEQDSQENDNNLRLWYTSPASIVLHDRNRSWEYETLPIGNGYMGNLIFGGISKERIHVNEKTMWSGGPGSVPNYNGGNRTSFDAENLADFREKLADKSTEVFGLKWGRGPENNPHLWKMFGDLRGLGKYEDFGDVYLDFEPSGINDDEATNYVRDLDLTTAVASVAFDHDGISYKREYFTSYPDNVTVMKLSASQPGSLSFNTNITSAQSSSLRTIVAEGDTITLKGRIADNDLKYEAQLRVLPQGGSLTPKEDGTIEVRDADSVVILLTAGTDYKNDYPTYRGEDPHEAVTDRIENASSKSYKELLDRHLEDYQEIFSRVSLDLGDKLPNVPTDVLLEKYKNGDHNKALEVLIYQMGRYLAIAGSREGTLPANLVGMWLIGDARNYWNADYHFNVNVQMNYWPVLSTNMSEVALSFNDYVDSLREPGRVTAAMSAGVKSEPGEENGFLVHTQNNPFGMTAPGGSQEYGWNVTGAAWALQNVYDYYRFTGDVDYLREKIYPMMKEQAKFWQSFLIWSEEQQRMVVSPSISPEQGPTAQGTTYDQSLVWQLLKETIEAAEILGVDEDLRAEWKELQDQLDPIIIGEAGQIKEWYEETIPGKAKAPGLPEIDIPNWQAGFDGPHRHASHLIGLFPGNLINKDRPEYMEAAKISLLERGFQATGWAKAHKINMWARTMDSSNTYRLIQSMIKGGNAGILPNLLNSHGGGASNLEYPIFQIEGNFGLTSGMTEVLLQSHLDYIQLLPTLPYEWKDGSFEGLRARGNFEIDTKWSDMRATEIHIHSGSGNKLKLFYPKINGATITDASGSSISYNNEGSDYIEFPTEAGQSYTITNIPEAKPLPSAPTLEKANRITDEAVLLEWTEGHNADSYTLYRTATSGFNYTEIASGLTDTIYVDDQAPAANGPYYYVVIANNDTGKSGYSNELQGQIDFGPNLVLNKPASASSVWGNDPDYSADKAVDGNSETRWASVDDMDKNEWLEVDFGKETTFNTVYLHEWGNRIAEYEIQYWDGDSWINAYTGSTIGAGSTVSFPAVTGSKVRLYISSLVEEATGGPTIYEFRVHHAKYLSDNVSAVGLKDLVEQFEAEGEFRDNRAAHSLKVHLTAVNVYEEKGLDDKVVKHMEGFKLLLNYQQEDKLISKQAYHILKANADSLLQKWE